MNSSLNAHQLLEKLAFDEITTASFPTHFSVILRLRTAMNDRQAPQRKILTMLKSEPVIGARIIQAANTAALYGHPEIVDLNTAVMTLGLPNVRRIALGVVMTQLAKSKELLVFANLSRSIWLHSLEMAMAASVFASDLTNFNQEEAFFAGLVVNMGAFYLLYQAARYENLQHTPDDVNDAVRKFNASATKRVLLSLKMPKSIITAADMTDFQQVNMTAPPKSLAEVVQAANILAMQDHPWFESFTADSTLGTVYTDLKDKVIAGLTLLHEDFH